MVLIYDPLSDNKLEALPNSETFSIEHCMKCLAT